MVIRSGKMPRLLQFLLYLGSRIIPSPLCRLMWKYSWSLASLLRWSIRLWRGCTCLNCNSTETSATDDQAHTDIYLMDDSRVGSFRELWHPGSTSPFFENCDVYAWLPLPQRSSVWVHCRPRFCEICTSRPGSKPWSPPQGLCKEALEHSSIKPVPPSCKQLSLNTVTKLLSFSITTMLAMCKK